MSTLAVEGLRVAVAGREILRGVDLVVRSGEVHAVMGPNGSGKSTLSHTLMGRPGYEILGGTVTLDGVSLLELPTWERARAGLFLSLQYPIEVPGVRLIDVLTEAALASGRDPKLVADLVVAEAERIGFDRRFVERPMNVDLSGGERKRNETLQLMVLQPKIAVLDELDSGLDIDALRAVARRVEAATTPPKDTEAATTPPPGKAAHGDGGLGVLAITHYRRLLTVLRADVVHVLLAGRIVKSGGPELAEELERTGYADYGEPIESAAAAPPAARMERTIS